MSESPFLNQQDAAAVCGKSYDTIRRYRRENKLPNSRTTPDGTVEVAVADLVACGLLDPLLACGPINETADRSRTERDLVAVRQDLAVAAVRIDALTERLSSAHAEVAFLRGLLKSGRES